MGRRRRFCGCTVRMASLSTRPFTENGWHGSDGEGDARRARPWWWRERRVLARGGHPGEEGQCDRGRGRVCELACRAPANVAQSHCDLERQCRRFVGGAIVRHPGTLAALNSVGRVEYSAIGIPPNGPLTAIEYGSLATPDGFHALEELDAVSRLRDGVAYPSVLMSVGANDPRVPDLAVGQVCGPIAESDRGRPRAASRFLRRRAWCWLGQRPRDRAHRGSVRLSALAVRRQEDRGALILGRPAPS